MTRRRFYVPRDYLHEGIAVLPSGQAHHLRDVLRIETGEIVEIFDGSGRGYVAEVLLQGSQVRIRVLQPLPADASRVRLILGAALIKSAKFEWMLQKATELGVDEIIPLMTCFSGVRIPPGKIALRLQRWDRLMKEASKQCRRLASPRMHAPLTFADFLAKKELSTATRLLFYEKASEPWRPDQTIRSDRIVLCIGPEGGWEGGEIERAKEAGYTPLRLGPWILRAETAAIAALSIIQHQLCNAALPTVVAH